MKINWNGFIKKAIEEYPKEACGFLFSRKPYSNEEEWFCFPVKNIIENQEEGWIPDKKDMLKVKAKAIKMDLVKIGNVHTHPYTKELYPYNEDTMQEIVQPSDKDLSFARRFNDVIRIIICVGEKAIYNAYVHDKFGNKINICLEPKEEK